jgi:hypothetical protein
MKTIIKYFLFGISVFALCYLYSPKSTIKTIAAIIPARFLVPTLSDSTYSHRETRFFEELKLIHGTFEVSDSCIYMYSRMFKDPVKLTVLTRGKVNFYVDIDTSIIQINNNSKTFLIDTAGIKLQYLISDYHIDSNVSEQQVISTFDINKHMSQCNEYFNNQIKTSKQLILAKESLDKLINNQLIFLIQKGYHDKTSNN